MVAAGPVVGNRIGVQPKRHDTGWVEVPNIWGAVVGRPGFMKSTALAKVLAPLKKLKWDAQTAHKTAQAQFKIELAYVALRDSSDGVYSWTGQPSAIDWVHQRLAEIDTGKQVKKTG